MVARKGYPKGLLKVPTIPVSAWVSQHDAAHILGVPVGRIGILISVDHLSPAHNPDGEAGVTAKSLADELNWRKSATIKQKIGRLLRDSAKFI